MQALARTFLIACLLAGGASSASLAAPAEEIDADHPFLVVLGVAQDAGIPQAGSHGHPAWSDSQQARHVVCLGLVDPQDGRRWLFEATPDFRQQLYRLNVAAQSSSRLENPTKTLDGVFLTHAHIGHYTGLMFLGHESMGTHDVPVYAMPRMRQFLEHNGPWDQLVRLHNIQISTLTAQQPVALSDRLQVTAMLVPHRQEYSEVVAFRIDGPQRSALFVPDIDSWGELDDLGSSIEAWIAEVDIAYLDGSFFANGEIPGRDMSGFPHPFITHSLERFDDLPDSEKTKIHFIHFNHTNPAARSGSAAQQRIEQAGFHVAREGDRVAL